MKTHAKFFLKHHSALSASLTVWILLTATSGCWYWKGGSFSPEMRLCRMYCGSWKWPKDRVLKSILKMEKDAGINVWSSNKSILKGIMVQTPEGDYFFINIKWLDHFQTDLVSSDVNIHSTQDLFPSIFSYSQKRSENLR